MSRGVKLTIAAVAAFLVIVLIGGFILARIASDYISPAKAEKILLNRHPTAYVTEIDADTTGTKMIYEIEFTINNTGYTATIDGKSGDIVSDTAEGAIEHTPSADNSPAVTDVQSATEKALGDAGFSKDEVNVTKAELENDDGKAVYDIEFIHDRTEYEYKINAETGAIENISSKVAE